MREFTEQELVRREKCAKLRELGLDPFGHKFERSATAMEIKDKYKDIDHEAFENMDDEATVAGRIMFIRKMGKASFFTIKDKTGPIQIYISINDIGEFITRFDGFPANYKEVLELIESADHDFLMVDSSRLYTRKDIIRLSQTMLNDTVNLISEVLDDDILGSNTNNNDLDLFRISSSIES